jgi:hypothetical protein
MVYELAPLHSYVRFYMTVVEQLRKAWEALGRTHQVARAALEPFGEPLSPAASPALVAALAPCPKPPAELDLLWRPEDPDGLGGLTDVYEVVGRFAFQGDDNANLGRVQAVVSGARNEIHAQRARLADLAKLSAAARATAERLAAEETRKASVRRAEKLGAFGPLAQTLAVRAKQSVDAVRGVPLPDLSNVDTAAAEYQKYATKVDQVYQTCLPFLRKALGDLYAFSGCETPQSWPDSLPLIRELPPEYVSVPPADSPELARSRTNVEALQEEETLLLRARDDVAVTSARLEGEIAAELQREAEARLEIDTAGVLLNHATVMEQVESGRHAMVSLETQKSQRTQAAGEVRQRLEQTQAAIAALDKELADRTQQIGQAGQRLAVERDNEPALFGKDDWRARVAVAEQEVETQRTTFAQRQGVLNQLKIDLSSLSVQVQTEQAQTDLIDRWVAELGAKERALLDGAREIEGRLGHARPPRPLSNAEAEQVLAAHQTRRAEILERIERLKAELRRQKEENARVIARLKQIELERQKAAAMAQSAALAATQGREAALKQLAIKRRGAVEQHVTEVLGTLERSLIAVEAVFVEPAKDAMLKDETPVLAVPQAVRAAADKVAPVVEQLARELEPELLAQDAMLGQVQREFCDVAANACVAAWG